MYKRVFYSLLISGLVIVGIAVITSCKPLKSIDEEIADKTQSKLKETKGKISIIDIYDNYQVNPNLITAWGFSCIVRTPTKDVLFDTGGDSSILLSNMERMDIDPKDIDIVVMSHIHGDHLGGLNGFLEKNKDVKVYIPSSFPNSIREKIKSHGAEYQNVNDSVQISDKVWITGRLGTWIKEQSLVLDTKKGTVVITGCAHPGIVNIIKKAKQILPNKDIYLVMGGFHLLSTPNLKLKSIIEELRDLGVKKVAPSHCSGDVSEVV
jgi:7,8-dihydropterin-6-yl-methyl-4-(beta-D-ribofuranosyl)aminobenzene 5'-phosphate synthase